MAHDDPSDPHHHDPNQHGKHGPHRDRGEPSRDQGETAHHGEPGHHGEPASGPEERGIQGSPPAADGHQNDQVPQQHKARAPAYAKVFVVTCSDTRTSATDEGGRFIRARLAELGHVHAGSAIVRDEPALIVETFVKARAAGAQVLLLTGGTGLSSRDSTFEAVSSLLARPLPGFGELFRWLSFAEIGSAAMLSRAVAGVTRDGLVVFAMPGSPGAVRLACEKLIFPELTHLTEELQR